MEHVSSTDLLERAKEALHTIHQAIPAELQKPCAGIICGTGLGSLVNAISPRTRVDISYGNIPHFVQSTGSVESFNNF